MNSQQAQSLAHAGHNPMAHANRLAATNPDGWPAMKDADIDPCVLHPCSRPSNWWKDELPLPGDTPTTDKDDDR